MNHLHRGLRRPHRFHRILTLAACLTLLLALGAAIQPHAARARQAAPELSWQVEALVSPPPGVEDTVGALALQERVAALLTDPTIAYQVDPMPGGDLRLALEGQGGLEQLRAALYSDLRGQLGLISGPSELVIHGAAAPGQPLPLTLDANITTGYAWDLSALDPAQLEPDGEPLVEPGSRPLGAPQRITIPLRAVSGGALEAHLLYRRPWESAENRLRLTLTTEVLPAAIDLSDPQPGAGYTLPPVDESLAPGGSLNAMADLPASFDWRNHPVKGNMVTPIKDQGGCGSCWAFGIAGLLESAVRIQNGPVIDTSEQYLVNCNDYGDDCGGGWWTSHDFHMNRYISPQTAPGSVDEADLPYKAAKQSCARNYEKQYQLAEWHWVGGTDPTVAQIKQAMMEYGPIGTVVCVGNAFNNYRGGVFATDETSKCPASNPFNHAVILVGWDDSTSTWIMKNSWDTWWGESGYMRIRYGVSNIGMYANYALIDSAVPTPNLSSPAAGAVISGFTPTLSWTASEGAAGYQVQISTESDFDPVLVDSDAATNSYTPASALPANRLLYWRVRAYTTGKTEYSRWPAARSFKTLPVVPVIAAPNGVKVNSLRPQLSWTEEGAVKKFEVQLSTTNDFYRLTQYGSPTAAAFTPTLDLPRSTQIYWRVRAVGTYGSSDWAGPAGFTTPNPPMNVPALLAPAGGKLAAPGTALSFSWSAPSAAPEGYRVEISRSSSFTDPDFTLTSTVPTVSHTFEQGNVLYYWRVSAYNTDSGSPIYSSPTAARTVKLLPGVPAPGYPVDEPVDMLRPTFTWSQPSSPLRYDYQIGKTPACGSLIKSGTVSQAQLTPGSDLPKGLPLYWRVRARGLYGVSAWSACKSFNTPVPPAVPSLLLPGSGSTLAFSAPPFHPTFTWKPAAGADGYIVELANNTQFTDPYPAVTLAGAASTSYTWPGDLSTGTYSWRVRAYRDDDRRVYSSWAWRSFKTPPALQGTVTEPGLGIPLGGVQVVVKGTALTTETNDAGQYFFAAVPAGSRTVVISGADVATTSKTMTVNAGGLRTLDVNVRKAQIKVVLDWTDHSQELDANLWLPAASPYHIKWSQRGSTTVFPFARLTSETSNGYGPEPVVITRRFDGTYIFAAAWFGYAGSSPLGSSGAVVKVYRGSELIRTLPVPAGEGNWWYVFDFDAKTGEFSWINELRADSPGPYDPSAGSKSVRR